MSGVTVEASNVHEARAKLGDYRSQAMIQVNLDHSASDINLDGPPTLFRISFSYGNEAGSKGQLTLEQLNREIARIIGLHNTYLADRAKSIAKRDAAVHAEALKKARKQLVDAKKALRKLERR